MAVTNAQYEVGDVVRVTFDFEDIDGTATDPSDVDITVTNPDGTTVDYTLGGATVVNDPAATGRFYCDHTITVVGIHKAKASATTPTSVAYIRFTAVQ